MIAPSHTLQIGLVIDRVHSIRSRSPAIIRLVYTPVGEAEKVHIVTDYSVPTSSTAVDHGHATNSKPFGQLKVASLSVSIFSLSVCVCLCLFLSLCFCISLPVTISLSLSLCISLRPYSSISVPIYHVSSLSLCLYQSINLCLN